MNRRNFLKAVSALAAGSTAPLPLMAASSKANSRPNIVLILTDDQGYADISFNLNHPNEVSTPNMDALGRESVFFKTTASGSSLPKMGKVMGLKANHEFSRRMRISLNSYNIQQFHFKDKHLVWSNRATAVRPIGQFRWEHQSVFTANIH